MAELGHTFSNTVPVFPARFRQKQFDLPRNALFSSLTLAQQRLILPYVKLRRVKSGKALLEEGARNSGKIFIVVDGQISAAKQALAPVEDRVATYEIGVLKRGDICGEVSFIDGKPSSLAFIAKTDVTVAVVNLSSAPRNRVVRRLKTIVIAKLRGHMASVSSDAVRFQVNSLKMENELAQFRNGVGHLVVATLCLLSFYTLMLSFLPKFSSLANANFALSPIIILLFALSFVPVIATSGFSMRFFGLRIDNWRPALLYSLKISAAFLAVVFIGKILLISASSTFGEASLIDGAKVEVGGRSVSMTAWYWVALFVYLLLTPMQEFVARSGIQAPLYAFLHGTEMKRRWWSILASNLVFAAAHAHISLPFAIAAFLPGLLWGWIFARTNSLLASTVSHIVIGGVAIFLFGIEGIVARLAP